MPFANLLQLKSIFIFGIDLPLTRVEDLLGAAILMQKSPSSPVLSQSSSLADKQSNKQKIYSFAHGIVQGSKFVHDTVYESGFGGKCSTGYLDAVSTRMSPAQTAKTMADEEMARRLHEELNGPELSPAAAAGRRSRKATSFYTPSVPPLLFFCPCFFLKVHDLQSFCVWLGS